MRAFPTAREIWIHKLVGPLARISPLISGVFSCITYRILWLTQYICAINSDFVSSGLTDFVLCKMMKRTAYKRPPRCAKSTAGLR